MKNLGLILLSMVGLGLITYTLTFTESSLMAVFMLLVSIGFFHGIKEHFGELNEAEN